jgi:putative tryptophan/tyrosine transport system substrate-binding protein
MDRRQALAALLGTMAIRVSAASAQSHPRARRIGFLMGLPEEQSAPLVTAFREGLRKLGVLEGRDVELEFRWPGIDADNARTFAREIISRHPDVIVASTNQVVSIIMQETQSIPIVFVFIGDPVGSRYADTIQRPGRNLTGFANFEAPMGAKWLEILRELSPATKRVGFVYHPDASPHVEFLHTAQRAARTLHLEFTAIPVRTVADIERLVFEFARAGPDGGVVVAPHALTLGSRALITDLAAQHRLPGVYGDGVFARSGGLLSYGINLPDQLRRAASYVDAILKGARPGDLPVQLPVSYEMIINLSVAKKMGTDVPPSVLARADELVE